MNDIFIFLSAIFDNKRAFYISKYRAHTFVQHILPNQTASRGYGNVTERTYRQLAGDSRHIASWLAKNNQVGRNIAILGSAAPVCFSVDVIPAVIKLEFLTAFGV